MSDDKTTETPSSDAASSEQNPSLDGLLADWENNAPKPDANALMDRVSALEGELTDQIVETEIVPHIKGKTDAPDKIVKGFLSESAAENPKLNELFANRKANRADFQKAMDGLRDDFQKLMGTKDETPDTEDTNAIAAAAAAARETPSDTGYDNVNWAELAPHEFEMKKRALFKAVQAGDVK